MWFRGSMTRKDREPALRGKTIRGLLGGFLLGILVPATGAAVGMLMLTVV